MSELAAIVHATATHRVQIARDMRKWEQEIEGEPRALIVLEAYNELVSLLWDTRNALKANAKGSAQRLRAAEEAATE